MICPTCKHAEENKYCGCGDIIPEEVQHLDVNPFSVEIMGDDSLHLECEEYREEVVREM
jgi:hypothetical protein